MQLERAHTWLVAQLAQPAASRTPALDRAIDH